MALQTAVFLGLLLTINILQTLPQLRNLLRQIEQRVPELAPIPDRWPLTTLVQPLNALIQREQASNRLRGQLRQQVQEAAAQEERNRLARDLHDSIKQQLYSVSLSAATAQSRWQTDPDGARLALTDVQQSAQAAMVEMNALLQQLRPFPLENKGLIAALHEQAQALALRTGAEVTTRFCQLPPDEWLPPGAQTSLFRLAQEALANIARHARANQVTLTLDLSGNEQDANLILTITDNGQGFDSQAAATGMGLANMKQRAAGIGADWLVESKPGQGTTIRLTLPLLQSVSQSETEDKIIIQAKRVIRKGLILVAIMSLLWLPLAFSTPSGFAFVWFASLLFSLLFLTTTVRDLLKQADDSGVDTHFALRQQVYLLRAVAYLGSISLALTMTVIFSWWAEAAIAALLLAVVGSGMALWEVSSYYRCRARQLRRMGPGQRQHALRQAGDWYRLRWLVTAVLLFNIAGNIAVNPPALPPDTMVHWLQGTLSLIGTAAFLFQLADTWFLRQWHGQLTQAAEVKENKGHE